ncbi:MAG TPA: spore germination protein GerPC [Bacillales bacterium]|nr:spore germination protein GerPC [Bacillales bacterium]
MYPHYYQQPYNLNQWQNRRIAELEKKVARLQEDIEALHNEPRMNVEKMEYKFDQLKIEKLDGTLNIGLSPGMGKEVLDEFSVGNQSIQAGAGTAQSPDMAENIRREIALYLEGNARNDLLRIEEAQQHPLDDPYRRFILDDIRKQINSRIQHYLKEMKPQVSETNRAEVEAGIIDRIRLDIRKGMENFLQTLKNGGDTK